MKTQVKNTSDIFKEFLENAPKNILKNQAIIINNGVWNVHIDYTGKNYEDGLNDLKLLTNSRPQIIKRISSSKKISEILYSTRELAEYCSHREFVVSIKAKDSILLNILLRLRIWSLNRFSI